VVKRYFDVNVFVYFLTKHPQYFERSYYWFSNTEEIYASEITLFQLIIILSKLLNKAPVEILPTLSSFFKDMSVRFVHLESDEIENVKEVAVNYNLDFEDAIHFYLSKKVGELISNDKELVRLGAKF